MQSKGVYISVGGLVVCVFISLLFIVFNASFFDQFNKQSFFTVVADFDNIVLDIVRKL